MGGYWVSSKQSMILGGISGDYWGNKSIATWLGPPREIEERGELD